MSYSGVACSYVCKDCGPGFLWLLLPLDKPYPAILSSRFGVNYCCFYWTLEEVLGLYLHKLYIYFYFVFLPVYNSVCYNGFSGKKLCTNGQGFRISRFWREQRDNGFEVLFAIKECFPGISWEPQGDLQCWGWKTTSKDGGTLSSYMGYLFL